MTMLCPTSRPAKNENYEKKKKKKIKFHEMTIKMAGEKAVKGRGGNYTINTSQDVDTVGAEHTD